MRKEIETAKYTEFTYEIYPQSRCPDCGRWTVDLDRHTCEKPETFDGTCPMCREGYRSFLDHMERCDP
jgi:uncharacterized protein (DUF983 family)